MEDHSTIAPESSAPVRKNTSWGAIIAILLILAMVVVGAFYAWGKRVAEQPGYTASASFSTQV